MQQYKIYATIIMSQRRTKKQQSSLKVLNDNGVGVFEDIDNEMIISIVNFCGNGNGLLLYFNFSQVDAITGIFSLKDGVVSFLLCLAIDITVTDNVVLLNTDIHILLLVV